jgi:hypothetical protein
VSYYEGDAASGSRSPGDSGRVRVIPSSVIAAVRSLVDNAMTKVFDRPYDVRSAADFERVMVEGGSATTAIWTAPAIAAAVKGATPWIERALPWARRSEKLGKAVPAARWVIMAVPIALQLGTTLRHGVRELQVVASYIIHLFREEGVEADRDLVTALTLSLVLDPERTPDLSLTPARAGTGLARRWILRSLGGDNANAVRRRARADLGAIGRLDFPELAREWQKRQPYDVG